MQSTTNEPLHSDKRKMSSRQYDTLPPSDDGTWTQLQEQIRAKILSKQMIKTGKSKKPKTTADIVKLKDKTKSSKDS